MSWTCVEIEKGSFVFIVEGGLLLWFDLVISVCKGEETTLPLSFTAREGEGVSAHQPLMTPD